MKLFFKTVFAIIVSGYTLHAQSVYRYSVDLNNVNDDQLTVELIVPKTGDNAEFHFPRIIPGTYNISDYGKFISNVKAYDTRGKEIAVKKESDNIWKISNSAGLHRIVYNVEDIFDTKQKHGIYPMAATNIEDKVNYVLNNPGIFGFLKGMNNLPYEVTVTKPAHLYASTAMTDMDASVTVDVFKTRNVDELYDAPIMYSIPDTTLIKVGNADVLISVYSPGKLVKSSEIASWLADLLDATRHYLGGKLPTDKYAFIYYFTDQAEKNSFPMGLGGALEHQTSSFYYLYDQPAEMMKQMITDISSHEFFHIITPLTIASKEVKEFNFSEAVLSKHLWLYEGVTEYASHHVQVKYGLNTVREFFDKLSVKITNSRRDYNDNLPFTELSKHSAGKHKDQYGNVYEKGALIGAALDIYLLHLSDGNYGLRNLTYDLGIRYGRDRYFNDDELFDEIGKLTYPEVKDFLVKYVGGPEAIPYEYYFDLAGVKFSPKMERKVVSFGGIATAVNDKGVLYVGDQSSFNEFGKKLGYKIGDEIYAFNGVLVRGDNFRHVIDSLRMVMKEGQKFEVKIGRKNASGILESIFLSAPVTLVTITDINKLDLVPNPTKKQEGIRKAWLTTFKPTSITEYKVDPKDVSDENAIVKALYEVISGEAGPRNWERFHSLFLPDAKMGAMVQPSGGAPVLRTMTPIEYQRSNSPFFMQSGFFEEELGRNEIDYGNIITVQSAYQFRFAPDGPVQQRGINFITLVKSSGRWWIQNLVWQSETKDNPIPVHLVK